VTSPLAELAVQYADYAVWQREYLQGAELERQLSYWREQLAGAPPVLELPTDRPRPPFHSYRGLRYSSMLPAESFRQLQLLNRREGVTLFMTLLAAFKVLLYHYAKRTDIVVGADIANRNRGATEGLIGFFVNMLVIRTILADDLTFKELLARVRAIALDAHAHQDVPFEKLVEELQPTRDIGYNPLFQVAFVLQNVPMTTLELEGLTITELPRAFEVAKFDLLLDVLETVEGLQISFVYNADLWDASTISHMTNQFKAILNQVVTDPVVELSTLAESLAEADRQQQSIKREAFKEIRRLKLKEVLPQPLEIN
jgi:non-ribosomal peptide synthetase component F